MVAPEFNKQALTNEKYQVVRTGIYSPFNIKIERCRNNVAYEILSNVFSSIAESRDITEPLQKLPQEYDNKVYRELSYNPLG